MSESTTPANAGATAADAGKTAQGAGEGSPSAEGSRTFTQDEVNSFLAKETRALKSKLADYDELKAKAARLDEIEEASKTDLEKAQAEAARWKERAERLESDAKRAAEVARAASEHGVDAELLARMEGDADENAKLLKERMASVPRYPDVADRGNQAGSAPKSRKEIASMTDRKARHDALVDLYSRK